MQFSKRLDRFGEEIFAALNNRRMELEAQGMKIYNMSVGTPDFKTPEHIKKALAELDGNAAMDTLNEKGALTFNFDGNEVVLTITGNTVSGIFRNFWKQSVTIIRNVLT